MPSRKRLIEIINSNDLGDTWRTFHSDQKQHTWVHSHNNVFLLIKNKLSLLKIFEDFKVVSSARVNWGITAAVLRYWLGDG